MSDRRRPLIVDDEYDEDALWELLEERGMPSFVGDPTDETPQVLERIVDSTAREVVALATDLDLANAAWIEQPSREGMRGLILDGVRHPGMSEIVFLVQEAAKKQLGIDVSDKVAEGAIEYTHAITVLAEIHAGTDE